MTVEPDLESLVGTPWPEPQARIRFRNLQIRGRRPPASVYIALLARPHPPIQVTRDWEDPDGCSVFADYALLDHAEAAVAFFEGRAVLHQGPLDCAGSVQDLLEYNAYQHLWSRPTRIVAEWISPVQDPADAVEPAWAASRMSPTASTSSRPRVLPLRAAFCMMLQYSIVVVGLTSHLHCTGTLRSLFEQMCDRSDEDQFGVVCVFLRNMLEYLPTTTRASASALAP